MKSMRSFSKENEKIAFLKNKSRNPLFSKSINLIFLKTNL